MKEALGARSLFELYNRLANGLHRNVHNLLGGVFGCPAPVAEIYRVNPSWAASYVEPIQLEVYAIISVWMELIVTGVMTCPRCDVSMRRGLLARAPRSRATRARARAAST